MGGCTDGGKDKIQDREEGEKETWWTLQMMRPIWNVLNWWSRCQVDSWGNKPGREGIQAERIKDQAEGPGAQKWSLNRERG